MTVAGHAGSVGQAGVTIIDTGHRALTVRGRPELG
jgi:hypothetical protein